MTDDKLIKNIIKKIGITNIHLAKLLRVDTSILTRIAAGTRQIPLKAIAILAQVQATIAHLPTVQPPQATPADVAECQQQIQWCTAQKQLLQKQLQQMKTLYEQGFNMKAFVEQYQVQHPPTTASQQRWFDEQLYRGQQKMEGNNWAAQQQIQLKIHLLQAEIDFYTQQVAE